MLTLFPVPCSLFHVPCFMVPGRRWWRGGWVKWQKWNLCWWIFTKKWRFFSKAWGRPSWSRYRRVKWTQKWYSKVANNMNRQSAVFLAHRLLKSDRKDSFWQCSSALLSSHLDSLEGMELMHLLICLDRDWKRRRRRRRSLSQRHSPFYLAS